MVKMSQKYRFLVIPSFLIVIAISLSLSTIQATENIDEIEKTSNNENIREFDHLIDSSDDRDEQSRESSNENYEKKFRLIINSPEIYASEKLFNSKVMDAEKNRVAEIERSSLMESIDDQKNSITERFSYVAREFYRYYWKKRDEETKKKNYEKNFQDRSAEFELKLPMENDDDDNLETIETTTSLSVDGTNQTLWRNIIGSPSANCPKGYRRDRNGRCRKTLW